MRRRDSAQADSSAKGRDSTAKAQHDTTAARGRKKKIEAATALSYEPSDSLVSDARGVNRFVWNLRYRGCEAHRGHHRRLRNGQRAEVLPGTYTVRLTADGKSYTQPFTVVNDPRTSVNAGGAAGAARRVVRSCATASTPPSSSARHIETMQDQLDARIKQVKEAAVRLARAAAGKPLRAKLEDDSRRRSSRCTRTRTRSRCIIP